MCINDDSLLKSQMDFKVNFSTVLIPTIFPVLLIGTWIPTVFQPRSENFADLMASTLVCIMFGFSGSV